MAMASTTLLPHFFRQVQSSLSTCCMFAFHISGGNYFSSVNFSLERRSTGETRRRLDFSFQWRGIELCRLKHESPSMTRWRCTRKTTSEETIMEGDVVEYPLPEHVRQGGLYGNRLYGLGAVSELILENSLTLCHLEPLVMDEPPQPTWIVDERQDMVVVPLTEVRRLQAWLSMRMIDDRISNPHGEHAEYLWLVEETLSPESGSPMYE